jgi:hypothetical protein
MAGAPRARSILAIELAVARHALSGAQAVAVLADAVFAVGDSSARRTVVGSAS